MSYTICGRVFIASKGGNACSARVALTRSLEIPLTGLAIRSNTRGSSVPKYRLLFTRPSKVWSSVAEPQQCFVRRALYTESTRDVYPPPTRRVHHALFEWNLRRWQLTGEIRSPSKNASKRLRRTRKKPKTSNPNEWPWQNFCRCAPPTRFGYNETSLPAFSLCSENNMRMPTNWFYTSATILPV